MLVVSSCWWRDLPSGRHSAASMQLSVTRAEAAKCWLVARPSESGSGGEAVGKRRKHYFRFGKRRKYYFRLF